MRILLAITTYNELEITKRCIESAIKSNINIDILLLDDYSQKECIKELANLYNVFYIGKIKHYGLTHSWNLAYKFFIENHYDLLFISNNDLLIPSQTLSILSDELLKSDKLVVVPSSTVTGAGIGKCGIAQGITSIPNIYINNSDNYQNVQNYLSGQKLELRETDFFNGFFFGLSRNIKVMEITDGVLFDPKRVNICNEIDLYTRIGKIYPNHNKILHVKNAFIYHYKAVTINIKKRDDLKKLEKKYS